MEDRERATDRHTVGRSGDVGSMAVTSSTLGSSFSVALESLLRGKRVARLGWNGQGMFLYHVQGSAFTVNREPLKSIMGEGAVVSYHGHIDMYTAQGFCVPWVASQTDLLANDWVEIASRTVSAVQPLT